jgi:hypothetical protein
MGTLNFFDRHHAKKLSVPFRSLSDAGRRRPVPAFACGTLAFPMFPASPR